MAQVSDFIDAADGDEQKFLTRYPNPFLVLEKGVKAAKNNELDYFTTMTSMEDLEAAVGRTAVKIDLEDYVYPVVKKPQANPYKDMYTIGRVDTCDIVVRSPSISKFHAYIARKELQEGNYMVVDAGSSNGTKLNGVSLVPMKGLEIKTGNLITLGGDAVLRFFLAKDFYSVIHKHLG
jgi:hypothetical protein